MKFTKYHLELACSFGIDNFTNINLRDADLRDADLCGANLRRADLCGVDLRGVDLRRANLRDANLRGANLRRADLCGVDLRGVDLRRANLRDANLRDADLRGANLRGVDLRRVDLCGVVGNKYQIKSMQIETYSIAYTSLYIQIGCQKHTIEDWKSFDDKAIINMDGKIALKFWRKFKDFIFMSIDLSPAEPTGNEIENDN